MTASASASLSPAQAPAALAAAGRLPDIERAKGLAILLVVFGHVVAREMPAGNEWYVIAKQAVYSFHMAFFMFLSGLVFFMHARPVRGLGDFMAAARKRFARLMPAYILFALLVLLGKWAAQSVLHVDNPVKGFGDLLAIALYPMQSVSSFLWYIHTLFFLSVAGLALYSLAGRRIWPLLLLGALLQWLPPYPLLGMSQFSKYFLFFSLGGLAAAAWPSYQRWLDAYSWLALAAFAASLISGLYAGPAALLVALLAIPALHGLCRRELPFGGMLLLVGSLTFPIYLMNTITIGLAKALLLKFLSWDGANFILVFFPLLMLSGVVLPMLVKKVLFARIGWLDRITR